MSSKRSYTDERAANVGAPNSPSAQGNLRFANEAFTAEMCILFGTAAGIKLPAAGADNGPLPSFATVSFSSQ